MELYKVAIRVDYVAKPLWLSVIVMELVSLESGRNAGFKIFMNVLNITFADFCHVSSGLELEFMSTFCRPQK